MKPLAVLAFTVGALPVNTVLAQMDHGPEHQNMGQMQGGSAPADARDPHAYSGGHTLTEGPYIQAWYGTTYDRFVIQAEGDVADGTLEESSTELLWGHALNAYFDTQLGVRLDQYDEGKNRQWLAIGMQGLAPYWFELDVTAYVGDDGRTALSAEAEYELLLTQRLILQPRAELNLYGKDDAQNGLGSGLSDLAVGLRLRYEFSRQFAPYIGVEWTDTYGDTADYRRAAGQDTSGTQFVAGLRFWF